jgi:hypothetical protein
MKSEGCELSLFDGDVFVQQRHSEHEHLDKRVVQGYPQRTKSGEKQ